MQRNPGYPGNGRYRLLDLLALDRFGSIWAAEDSLRRRRVTVRQISRRLAADPAFVERLHGMGRGLIRFSHPNVASVLDLSAEAGGALFIVMEPMRGETLAGRLLARGSIPEKQARRIVSCLTDALRAAHRVGIEHGPVTPENVMLTTKGEVKLMDFGVVSASRVGGGRSRRGADPPGSSPLRLHAWGSSLDLASVDELMARMHSPSPPGEEPERPRPNGVRPALEVSVFPPELLSDGTAHRREHRRSQRREGRAAGMRSASRARAPARLARRVGRGLARTALGIGAPVKRTGIRAGRGLRWMGLLPWRALSAGGRSAGRAGRAVMAHPGTVGAAAAVAAVAVVIGVLTLSGSQASEGRSVFEVGRRKTADSPPPSPSNVTGGVEVPNLSGLSAYHAQERLDRLGLEFGGVLPVTGSPGRVMATSPRAGERVGPGTVITLLVGARTDRMEGASIPG
jgi:hypothetical protein